MYVKARNLEKELKEIRKGLAWMRTEQKEMKRWIRNVLRDPSSLLRSRNIRGVPWSEKKLPICE
jgi:hypothetical protein